METVQVQQRTDSELCVRDVRSKIYAEMEHAYLSGYLRSPDLERLQLVLADAMVRSAGLPKEESELVVSTLLLIYHGLAVHDDIDKLSARPDEKYRQLGVLAGDYFSSKYYRLLAEAGQVALIGRFALAIQAINEAKSELERDPADFGMSIDQYLGLQERIHGELLHCLREAYLPNDPVWEELVNLFVRATVLQKELIGGTGHLWTRDLTNLLLFKQTSGEERRWLKRQPTGCAAEPRLMSLHVKYGTSHEVYRMIEDCIRIAETTIMNVPELMEDLRELCERLTEYQPVVRRAEER
jgi:heptaprenyl diphosphate synthase